MMAEVEKHGRIGLRLRRVGAAMLRDRIRCGGWRWHRPEVRGSESVGCWVRRWLGVHRLLEKEKGGRQHWMRVAWPSGGWCCCELGGGKMKTTLTVIIFTAGCWEIEIG